jgi:adenylate cyclase
MTWRVAEGCRAACPLRCFFEIQSALDDAAPWFESHFDIALSVHGALHAAPVVAGEVGVNRPSIAFHGGVMNVSARLEEATHDMSCPFIASHEAIRPLAHKDGYHIHDHGLRRLRGRHAPVQVFDVSWNH